MPAKKTAAKKPTPPKPIGDVTAAGDVRCGDEILGGNLGGWPAAHGHVNAIVNVPGSDNVELRLTSGVSLALPRDVDVLVLSKDA